MSLLQEPVSNVRKKVFAGLCVFVFVSLIALGVMAKNGWLPTADAMTGKKTGWFGRELPKNAGSIWNPLAAPLPTATPQLSKEYIYAGSRMLAVEDANASAAVPADLAVWRAGTGDWYVMGPGGTIAAGNQWGASGDMPVPGDYDGDGKTDFAVVRPNNTSNYLEWYVLYSSSGSTSGGSFGLPTDKAVPADYDGDGRSDMAVFRASTNNWYILKSSDSSLLNYAYGSSGDVASAADYDGDGKADPTVWRLSNTTFYTLKSSDLSTQSINMTVSGTTYTSNDKVVSADYDGDGKANYAIRNGASWLIANAALSTITATTPSGDLSSDIPVQNDYDGDGIVDIAVWRPSNGDWYIRKSASSGSLRQEHWGQSGDVPVPSFWKR